MRNSRPIRKYCNIKASFPSPIPNKCVIRPQRCLWPHLLFLAGTSLTPRCCSSLTYRRFNWFVSKLFIQQASLQQHGPSSDIDFTPPCRLALTLLSSASQFQWCWWEQQPSGLVLWGEVSWDPLPLLGSHHWPRTTHVTCQSGLLKRRAKTQ